MLSHLTQSITALTLALTSHASIPGWSPAAIAAPAEHKCTAKSHRHVKVVVAKPSGGGAGLVERRRSPDVQVISFGP
jgi:hypothetical protein